MENMSNISTLISFMMTLFFWAALVLVIIMVRQLSKDVAEVKKMLSSLEESLLMISRAPALNRSPEEE